MSASLSLLETFPSFDMMFFEVSTPRRGSLSSVLFLMYSPFPSSLKQSGMHTGNPWPPYKERTPLHPCYRGLIKLLHCKTLHIVIFTLLYKVRFAFFAIICPWHCIEAKMQY